MKKKEIIVNISLLSCLMPLFFGDLLIWLKGWHGSFQFVGGFSSISYLWQTFDERRYIEIRNYKLQFGAEIENTYFINRTRKVFFLEFCVKCIDGVKESHDSWSRPKIDFRLYRTFAYSINCNKLRVAQKHGKSKALQNRRPQVCFRISTRHRCIIGESRME